MKSTVLIKGKEHQICTKCIYDDRVAGIYFDEEGVCNYCHTMEMLQQKYRTGYAEGEAELKNIIDKAKHDGRHKKYDCVVGVSGGTDSSYLLVKLKEWGLRPLAVHYDNTWNTAIATENIKIMLKALDIDLYTYVVDNNEADDIYKSFIKAGVPELEASTDLAFVEVLYRAASKYRIKYIFEGASFKTEGVSPISNNYFDGGYIKAIHKQFGELPMKTYPLMTFSRFLYWMIIKRIRRIRPFWYVDYTKEEARRLLTSNYGWQYYGGHHLDNRMTAVYHGWYMLKKFDTDFRNLSLGAATRTGVMDRDEAIHEYFYSEPYMEDGLMDYFKERMGYSDSDLEEIISSNKKDHTYYYTYKKRFRRLAPIFYFAMKANLVPESFYFKYCKE